MSESETMNPATIRGVRMELGLSLREWARIFCVTDVVAGSWERRSQPPPAFARTLIVALQIFVTEHRRRNRIVVSPDIGRPYTGNRITTEAMDQLLHVGRMLKTGFGPTLYYGLGALLETEGAKTFEAPVSSCHASSDGECGWIHCPQLQDDEPARTGRHCPIDHRHTDEES